MNEWEWYDWHIALGVAVGVALILLPFACWVFGWTIQP